MTKHDKDRLEQKQPFLTLTIVFLCFLYFHYCYMGKREMNSVKYAVLYLQHLLYTAHHKWLKSIGVQKYPSACVFYYTSWSVTSYIFI